MDDHKQLPEVEERLVEIAAEIAKLNEALARLRAELEHYKKRKVDEATPPR